MKPFSDFIGGLDSVNLEVKIKKARDALTELLEKRYPGPSARRNAHYVDSLIADNLHIYDKTQAVRYLQHFWRFNPITALEVYNILKYIPKSHRFK